MPGRRKSKDELARDSLPQPEGDESDGEGGDGQSKSVDFEALSDAEHDEFNELFALLNGNGYETLGDYGVTYRSDIDRKVATVSVVLPATNDWDPSMAFDSDGDD